MFEKYSLLNLMYKKLYIRNFIKINLAPPRETLKMFGGYLSIEEFRESNLYTDSYSMNLVKYNYIYPEITEVTHVKSQKQNKNHLKLSRN